MEKNLVGAKAQISPEIVEYINGLLAKSGNWTAIGDLAASRFKSKWGNGQQAYYKAQAAIKNYMALNLAFENGVTICR